jgi:hypothetical protein
MKNAWRLLGVGAFLLGAAVPAAAVPPPMPVPCAEFITTGLGDEPDGGELLGSETRREHWGGGASIQPGGVGGSYNGGREREYEVGYYRMGTGRVIEIDCRTYTYASSW